MTTPDTTTAPGKGGVGKKPVVPPAGREAPDRAVPNGTPRARAVVAARPRPRRPVVLRAAFFVGLTLLGAAVFAGAGAVYAHANPREYKSEALVAMLPTPSTTVVTTTSTTTTTALSVSADYTGIWVKIGNSDLVRVAAADRLGITRSELADAVTVAPSTTSAALISVTAGTGDPARSASWANAVAAQLVSQSSGTTVPGFTLKTVAAATAPTAASGLAPGLIVGLAALVGAVVGFFLARLVHRRLRSRQRAAA